MRAQPESSAGQGHFIYSSLFDDNLVCFPQDAQRYHRRDTAFPLKKRGQTEAMSDPVAARAIEAAFERLKQAVTRNDANDFQATKFEDVRQAAIDIEKWQRQRKSLRNMGRIQPLLTAIGQYAVVIDTLCQGTPYLPFLWVR
jgi:hypothetical protein